MYKRLFASIIFAALILTVPVWADIQDDLIGYWPMDEGSGGTVADASGNSNDGAAHDTSWVDGRYNSALEFDGVASFVDIPYFPELSPTGGVTMAAWVFPTDTTRSCIVGQFEAYGMSLFTGLQLKSVIWGDDWVQADQTIPVQEWSHIAMTWDTTTNDRTMILNGEVVAERPGAVPVPQAANNLGIGLWVGWPADWADDWFMGTIDDVKLWNRALTADEAGEASLPSASVEPRGKLATAWGSIKLSP